MDLVEISTVATELVFCIFIYTMRYILLDPEVKWEVSSILKCLFEPKVNDADERIYQIS